MLRVVEAIEDRCRDGLAIAAALRAELVLREREEATRADGKRRGGAIGVALRAKAEKERVLGGPG